KQLPANMILQLSPVVLEEIISHRMKGVAEAASSLAGSIANLQRLTGIDLAEVSRSYEKCEVIKVARASFKKDVMDYVKECSGDVLDYSWNTAERIFNMYFNGDSPF